MFFKTDARIDHAKRRAEIFDQQTRLGVEYATIVAEIDGRLGAIPLRAGNFVRQAENTAITTLTQMDPILVQFSVPERWLPQIRTAGAIYLGNDSPVAVGDFLAGPSHTLPTGGSGRSFSGIRADQFQRRTSIVRLDKNSVRKSLSVVEEFARIEGLDAHGRSTAIRLEK